MDYTLSNAYTTDAATGLRMHLQTQAVTTAVSDADMNMLIWEAMEIVKAGGGVGAPFDKAQPASYQKLLTALRAAGVFQTQATTDNSTRAATTAYVKALFGGSFSQPGFIRIPSLVASSGLILNYFRNVITVSNASGDSTFNLTYAVSFPTTVLTSCFYPVDEGAATNAMRIVGKVPGLSGMSLLGAGGLASGNVGISGFVLGY